jgi:hypothetical protein
VWGKCKYYHRNTHLKINVKKYIFLKHKKEYIEEETASSAVGRFS